jgi:hypothetical protein
MLKRLLHLSGLDRILYFLKLLETMARSEHSRTLASKGYQLENHKNLDSRLDKVMHFYQYELSPEDQSAGNCR